MKILAVCAIFAILLPSIDAFFTYPKFINALKKITEREAEQLATILMRSTITSTSPELTDTIFPEYFDEIASQCKLDHHFVKLKVYNPSGRSVYSTDPNDIGKIHEKSYFQNIIAKGNKFTHFIKRGKNFRSEELRSGDIIETYVPMMVGDEFIGAFEIYYDVTSEYNEFNGIRSRMMAIQFLIGATFFLIIFIISIRLESTKSKLGTLHQILEQNPSSILLINNHGRIEYANEQFLQLANISFNDIIGKDIYEVYGRTPDENKHIWDRITLSDNVEDCPASTVKTGNVSAFKSFVSKIKNAEGMTTHILATFNHHT